MPDVTFALNKMKVHCVYIPDVTLSICRMSLLLKQINESALCLNSGCCFVYMPDVRLAKNKKVVNVHCDYIHFVLNISRLACSADATFA